MRKTCQTLTQLQRSIRSKLCAVALLNPLHILSDTHIMTDRLGADHAFAYAAMLEVGSKALTCYAIWG